MKYYASGKALAEEMKVDPATIMKTFQDYNTVAEKQLTDPNSGPYDAYGGGKSHDPWGKKFFHNLPLDTNDEFHVAIVTPVIHYCMGGLKINPDSEVLRDNDSVISGLYVAGEACGGIHGSNR